MSEVFKIVQWVLHNSVSKNIAIARLSLRVGEDVLRVTKETIEDEEKIEKFKKAAEAIIGKPYNNN